MVGDDDGCCGYLGRPARVHGDSEMMLKYLICLSITCIIVFIFGPGEIRVVAFFTSLIAVYFVYKIKVHQINKATEVDKPNA